MSRSNTPSYPARKARPRQPLLLLTALAGALVLLAGCTGGGTAAAKPGTAGAPTTSSATPTPRASIAVTPITGTQDVRPDTTVTVAVRDGTLNQVRVRDEEGQQLAGVVSPDGTGWTASERLQLDTRYTVRATAVDRRGTTTTVRAAFSTLDPPRSRRLRAANVSPLNGWVVGVAQPLVVGFNHPVRNRAAVQQALRVETSPQVAGAWYWIDPEHVHFRPRAFWPAGTKVTLHADVAGVDAGGGYWGAANRTVSFQIGRAQVINIDVKRLVMTVQRGGKAVRAFRVTSGKKGWETRNGTKVIMEKVRNKVWTNDAIDAPEDYTLHSDFALRMTNSGEFIHDAPWNIGNLGRRSASHGCVGMRSADAAWLFRNTLIGDPVVVTGSPRAYGPIWNRYGDWNVPWSTWSAGNAD